MLLVMALGPLEAAGMAKIREDENDTGKDDATGVTMVWIAQATRALVNDKPLPRLPPAVTKLATA